MGGGSATGMSQDTGTGTTQPLANTTASPFGNWMSRANPVATQQDYTQAARYGRPLPATATTTSSTSTPPGPGQLADPITGQGFKPPETQNLGFGPGRPDFMQSPWGRFGRMMMNQHMADPGAWMAALQKQQAGASASTLPPPGTPQPTTATPPPVAPPTPLPAQPVEPPPQAAPQPQQPPIDRATYDAYKNEPNAQLIFNYLLSGGRL